VEAPAIAEVFFAAITRFGFNQNPTHISPLWLGAPARTKMGFITSKMGF
jgi:hypothetical protein